MSSIVDTHCHLDFNTFDIDRVSVVARAEAAGVDRILNPGIDLITSRAALSLTDTFRQVYAACGVHPNDAMTWNEQTLDELRRIASHQKVIALGEIGLDYYRDRAPREVQRQVFSEQLALASDLELPVVIHCREAIEDMLDILEDWVAQLSLIESPLALRPGVMHSFSGDSAAARKAIEMNFFIGVTGPVTFRNAKNLQQTIEAIPLTSLLIETDAPFLTPHPHRGERNEPAYVRWVAEKIAEIKNLPTQAVAEQTFENSIKLFNW